MTGHTLAQNAVLQGAEVALDASPLAPEDVVDGDPSCAAVELAALGDTTVGVWELGVGVVQDTEIDEVFVVLSGEATVEFADGTAPLELRAGSIGRLAAGTRTTWTVRETLRKVYIA